MEVINDYIQILLKQGNIVPPSISVLAFNKVLKDKLGAMGVVRNYKGNAKVSKLIELLLRRGLSRASVRGNRGKTIQLVIRDFHSLFAYELYSMICVKSRASRAFTRLVEYSAINYN